jgi:hypothetical protein
LFDEVVPLIDWGADYALLASEPAIIPILIDDDITAKSGFSSPQPLATSLVNENT